MTVDNLLVADRTIVFVAGRTSAFAFLLMAGLANSYCHALAVFPRPMAERAKPAVVGIFYHVDGQCPCLHRGWLEIHEQMQFVVHICGVALLYGDRISFKFKMYVSFVPSCAGEHGAVCS